MARLSFRCEDELVQAVDRARGGVPRERWLRDVVEEVLAQGRGVIHATLEPIVPSGGKEFKGPDPKSKSAPKEKKTRW